MSDDLLRRFRDKIHGRPSVRRRSSGAAPEGGATLEGGAAPGSSEEEVPVDSLCIRAVQHGPFPSVSALNRRFQAGVLRVRLTLDLGSALRARGAPLRPSERQTLLLLCPRLMDHACGGGIGIQAMLDARGPADGTSAGASAEAASAEDSDGLALAHLIEHVAIDLVVSASGARRCSGVTCAYRERLDRFDIFLECPDPLLGRALAVLAAVSVRDLVSGSDRLEIHRRCRDLLRMLARSGRTAIVPEDAAGALGCDLGPAREALEALVRLGYLDPAAAGFTFSSASGVLFRRARPDA